MSFIKKLSSTFGRFSDTQQTLVLVTPEILARYDHQIVEGEWVTSFYHKQNDVYEEAHDHQVLTALELGPQRYRDVWVASTSLWCQALNVSSVTYSDLSEDQVKQSLAFETEPYSGIDGLSSELSAVKLGNDGVNITFWVNQISKKELEKLRTSIKKTGGSLKGLFHPSGVRGPLGESQATSWSRLEIWPRLMVGVIQNNKEFILNTMPTDQEMESWTEPAEFWFSSLPSQENVDILTFNGALPQLSDRILIYDLCQQEQIKTWMSAAAKHLKETSKPLLVPSAPPMTQKQKNLVTVGVIACVLLVCIFHYSSVKRDIARIRSEAKKIKDPSAITAQLNQDEANKKVLSQYRQRYSDLLYQFAANTPDGVNITSIEHQGGNTLIKGICVDPELPNQLAKSLEKNLSRHGWKMSPPKKSGVESSGGSAWNFEFVLENQF